MVTENGRQNRLIDKMSFWTRNGGLIDKHVNFKISAQLNTKNIFQYFMFLVNIYNIFKNILCICLCSMLTVKPPSFGPRF